LLALQIALGGWVSVNYASLACGGFPLCNGSWVPEMDFASGFHFLRELGMTAEGEPLSKSALTAIHWAHRLGALIVFCYLALLAIAVVRTRGLQKYGALLLIVLCVQVVLGIGNVLLSLPLALAAAHNAAAALLLIAMVVLNFKINRTRE
ncbi:MAG: COX15/CtaA family protein, partial [Burkholderiales bacterium]